MTDQKKGDELFSPKTKTTLSILSKKYRGDSSVISSRLPADLIETLDQIAGQTGRTRNEIIQLCLEFALDHIEIQ